MSLEMLIYLIEVGGRLSALLAVGAVVLGAATLVALFVWFVNAGLNEEPAAAGKRAAIHLAIATSVVATVAVFAPTRNTLYAIAAVHLGKEAAATEMGQRILRAAERRALETLEPKGKAK